MRSIVMFLFFSQLTAHSQSIWRMPTWLCMGLWRMILQCTSAMRTTQLKLATLPLITCSPNGTWSLPRPCLGITELYWQVYIYLFFLIGWISEIRTWKVVSFGTPDWRSEWSFQCYWFVCQHYCHCCDHPWTFTWKQWLALRFLRIILNIYQKQ